jgi:hypothetical protein
VSAGAAAAAAGGAFQSCTASARASRGLAYLAPVAVKERAHQLRPTQPAASNAVRPCLTSDCPTQLAAGSRNRSRIISHLARALQLQRPPWNMSEDDQPVAGKRTCCVSQNSPCFFFLRRKVLQGGHAATLQRTLGKRDCSQNDDGSWRQYTCAKPP